MTIDEKIKYAKSRVEGARLFSRNVKQKINAEKRKTEMIKNLCDTCDVFGCEARYMVGIICGVSRCEGYKPERRKGMKKYKISKRELMKSIMKYKYYLIDVRCLDFKLIPITKKEYDESSFPELKEARK